MFREKDPICGQPLAETGPEAIGNLQNLLTILRTKEASSFQEKQAALARKLLERLPSDLPVPLGGDDMNRLVLHWSDALRTSSRLDTPPDRILCGFSSVADVTYFLDVQGDEVKAFIEWAADKLHKSSDELLDEAKVLADAGCQRDEDGKEVDLLAGDGQTFNLVDVVAILLWCMANGEGKKPALRTPEIWRLMQEYVAQREATGAKVGYTLGGAAGNMCYVLRHLDLDVSAHWQYHPEPVATDTASPYCLKRLLIEGKGWPFFPLFGDWHIEPAQGTSGKLVFEIASDDVMRQIGEQFDYFIITGIQGLGGGLMNAGLRLSSGATGTTVGTVVKHALRKQLQVLVDTGVVIHTEIPAPTPELFDVMAEVIRSRVQSVGINDDDLLTVTGDERFRGSRFFFGERQEGEQKGEKLNQRSKAIFRRYQRAKHLAAQLDVDELYVHGNDVDLIVRRRTTRGSLRREVEADLFAKGVVILALLQRSGGERWEDEARDLPPILAENGFVALLEFAKAFALDRYPNPNQAEQARQLFRQLLATGYFFERQPETYSVIIVPVLWPTPEPEIGTTGAGDITSSVVAIFSGK